MEPGLTGKVALVTGEAREIGREISLTLAREGAATVVNRATGDSGAALPDAPEINRT